jgi:aminoglycoside phosphotransferase (APT) family kinase protein
VEVALAGLVLEQLAHLHATLPRAAFATAAPHWDYDAELVRSAQTTLAQYERVVAHEDLAALRPVGPALRRMVDALPAVRRQLGAAGPFGPAVLHGDVHAGNAVVRAQSGTERVVLLDWARARVGPPLEDVSSWLQSLGFWEPVARRRHDTLLRRYLAARGASTHLGRDLRDAYWLAAAGNALAGALRYYLTVADGWGGAPSRARADAARAARDHLRVLRRADAVWRR